MQALLSDKTFALDRTLPATASNIKLVITEGNTYLELIESADALASSSSKGFAYDHAKPLSVNYSIFSKAFAKQSNLQNLWHTKTDLPNYVTSIERQHFDLYSAGSYSDTRTYIQENFRYFAPLFLNDQVPDAFVIRAVDKTSNNGYQKGRILASFDLSVNTDIGRTLRAHLAEIQKTSLGVYTNFASIEYTGTDALSGIITTKSISSVMTSPFVDRPLLSTDHAIVDGWATVNLIDTRYLNIEFCFDLSVASTASFETIVGDYVYVSESESSNDAWYLVEDRSGVLSSTPHESIDKIVGVVKRVKIQDELSAILEFRIVTDHTPNSRFSLIFDNVSQIDVVIPAFTGTLDALLDYYVSFLSVELARTSTSVDIRTGRSGNVLRFISNSTHEAFANIYVAAYPAEWRLLDSRVPARFKRPGENTFVTTQQISDSIEKVRYANVTYNLIESFSYDNLYCLVADTVSSYIGNDSKLELIRTIDSRQVSLEEVERRTFKTDFETSDYSNVLDFDLVRYRAFLESFIESDEWAGEPSDLPTIRSSIAQYFNSIDIDRKLLLGGIDSLTGEFSSIDNQYDRFNERLNNDIQLLSPKSSLHAYRTGTDVYANPYSLNVNVTYRYDNFSPISVYDRSLALHTHSWLVIGHGKPPYADGFEFPGYSTSSVSRSILAGGDLSSVQTSIVYRSNEHCYTFFRGALLRLPLAYEGYSFTAVLLSNEPLLSTDRSIEVLVNDTMKTIAVLVRVYLPEPILCSGGDPNVYWLDRSLLYFVDRDYSLSSASTVLGSSRISLDFYNNQDEKYFNGMPVGTSWLYDDKISVTSQRSIAPIDLRSVIALNSDFEVFFGDVDDAETIDYGMSIVFQNIQEVTRSNFWCEEIIIRYKETVSSVTTVYEKSIKQEWLANNLIFDEDNQYATARYLALHNARFERTLSNVSSIDRYSLLSTGSILDELARTSFLTYVPPATVTSTIFDSTRTIELVRYPGYYDLATESVAADVTETIDKYVQKFSTNVQDDTSVTAVKLSIDTLSLRNYYSQSLNDTVASSISWTSYPAEVRSIYLSKVFHYLDTFDIILDLSSQTVSVFALYNETSAMTMANIPNINQEALDHCSLHTINRIYRIDKIVDSQLANYDYIETYDSYIIRNFSAGAYTFTVTRR